MYVVFICVCSEFDIDPVGQFSLVKNSVCGRGVTSLLGVPVGIW